MWWWTLVHSILLVNLLTKKCVICIVDDNEHPLIASLQIKENEAASRQETHSDGQSNYAADSMHSSRQSITNSDKIGELACPNVHLYVKRDIKTGKTTLDCLLHNKSSPPKIELTEIRNYPITCTYWYDQAKLNLYTDSRKDESLPRRQPGNGRGIEFKIFIRPKSRSNNYFGYPHLELDQLAPNALYKLISHLKHQLGLQLSVVHLSISLITFSEIRQSDLSDLSSRLQLTRLTIWNPKSWAEDSLMPLLETNANLRPKLIQSASPFTSSPYPSLPSYFRLIIFCDASSDQAAFHRLWLPWISWQIQLHRCASVYSCRPWVSTYPVCPHNTTHAAFKPTYILAPQKPPHPRRSPRGEGGPEWQQQQQKSGSSEALSSSSSSQMLYSSQCKSTDETISPFDDLRIDYRYKCWTSLLDDHEKNPDEIPIVTKLDRTTTPLPEYKQQTTSSLVLTKRPMAPLFPPEQDSEKSIPTPTDSQPDFTGSTEKSDTNELIDDGVFPTDQPANFEHTDQQEPTRNVSLDNLDRPPAARALETTDTPSSLTGQKVKPRINFSSFGDSDAHSPILQSFVVVIIILTVVCVSLMLAFMILLCWSRRRLARMDHKLMASRLLLASSEANRSLVGSFAGGKYGDDLNSSAPGDGDWYNSAYQASTPRSIRSTPQLRRARSNNNNNQKPPAPPKSSWIAGGVSQPNARNGRRLGSHTYVFDESDEPEGDYL